MSEWWTYTLSDFLMFSPRTYWRLVELYNRDFWPLHLPLLAAGLAALWLTATRRTHAFRWVAFGLSAIWLWVGWAFLWERYATINWAAQYVALAFAVQAVLLAGMGLMRKHTAASPGPAALGLGGLLAVAGLLYPLWGLAAGRPWEQAETFGMAPEPTAPLTLGLLLLSGRPASRTGRALLFPIPLLCLLLGAATAWTFVN
ncbi:MAG: DUF6064 family protein [Polaromonas sp.]|uniref:DUF6064 family protein n=1 Tax=Polaromonas sp. TaxID=1869339 RepID=UPI0024876BCF|nr:DUF6064 family protein [Polaromonas sp.]MDI1271397.1 DUF6064 family protein [Polaromonas sp.]